MKYIGQPERYITRTTNMGTCASSEKSIIITPSTKTSSIMIAEDEISRTPSVAFREGEKEAIERVLETVEEQAEKRVRDGFSEVNFTVGVLNCFFILFMFNVYPQHFWIIYIVEAFYLFPAKFRCLINAKPLNEAFFYLDLCWFMNFSGVIALIVVVAGREHISDEARKQIYLAFYGTAIGPMIFATAFLPFISLVFHHLESMTSVFIHFYPPLLFYILRWKKDAVKEAWPNSFDLDYDIAFWPQGSFTGCVFGNTIIFYLIWLVPYFLWQLFIGLDLPRAHRRTKLANGKPAPAKYDTVFHANMRNGLCLMFGKLLWNRPKYISMEQIRENDFEMRDFLFYMGWHVFSAVMSLVMMAYPCYLSKYVHVTFLWVLAALCTYRGSKRYTYYSTKMYSRIIRKHFSDEINQTLPATKNRVSEISPLQVDSFKDNSYRSFTKQADEP